MRPAKGKGLLRRTQRAALLREPEKSVCFERRRVPAHQVDAARRIPVRYAKAAAPRQSEEVFFQCFSLIFEVPAKEPSARKRDQHGGSIASNG